jgi:hypothetical protein
MNLDDTIVAIATPPGRGGIGVVRLAGTAARTIIEPLLRLKHPLEAGRAAFGELIEPSECGAGDPARVTAGVPQYASRTASQGSKLFLISISKRGRGRLCRMGSASTKSSSHFSRSRIPIRQTIL